MPQIGLRHPCVAPITAETSGSMPTYGAGRVVGTAVSADLQWTKQDNNFYSDDHITENDNSVSKGTMRFGLAHLKLSDGPTLFGMTKTTGTSGSPDVYTETGAPAPYLGFGYIRVLRMNGDTIYRACLLIKTQFGLPNETGNTKGENITWQNPTIEGTVFGVYIDSSGDASFRQQAEFTTYAAAEAWLHSKLNITT